VNTPIPPLARDGHLSPLTLERLALAELGADAPAALHVASCPRCQAALAAIQAEDAALTPPAWLAPRRTAHRAPRHATRWLIPASALVAAAAALVIWQPAPPPIDDRADTVRIKGAGAPLELSIYVRSPRADAAPRRVVSGEQIAPGDEIGFEVRAARPGHLLVVGVDALGSVYIGYPQDGGGESAPHAASGLPEALPEALAFDDVPGRELLVAIRCDAPFSLDALRPALIEGAERGALPMIKAGCDQQEVWLEKVRD
jgi:hypothetical protein